MRFLFNNFVLDCEQRVLWKQGEAVPLSPKVFETLDLLVQSGGRIVTKQEFMEALWPDSFVEDGNLTQNIFILRKVLGSSQDGRPYIETFPRRGYRFVGAVRREDDLPPDSEPWKIDIPQGRTFDPAIGPSPDADTMDRTPVGPIQAAPPLPQSAERRLTQIPRLAAFVVFGLLLLSALFFVLRWKTRIQVGGYRRITNDGKTKDPLVTPPMIAQSGNTLYFNELGVLAQVPVEGGEVSYDRTLPANVHVVGLEPGGRDELIFGSNWPLNPEQPLLRKDASTGSVSNVFDIHAQDASWSPDGTRLAYTQLSSLFVRSADGTTVLAASVGGVAFWPRWSPDGHTLRFSESYRGIHYRLWQVESAGGGLHELFAGESDSGHLCCGSWTSSGRGFVYLSIENNNSRIHVRTADSIWWNRWAGQSIEIPAAPLDRWAAPVPSRDGKQVFAIGEQLHGQLVRIDPSTRQPEPFIGGLSAEGLSYSPDCTDIVWTAYPEGTLWRSRSDGSDRVQLTQAPLLARFPHWSPDGSTIVFTAARPGSDWQLYTVPANGGEVKPLVPESRGQGVATWSPDGKALVFGHILDVAEARKQPFDIEVFRPGDRSVTRIPGSTGLWTARWSPDGRFLSAVTEDNRTLRLYNVQTETWSDLAHADVNDVVWSPDSKSLFFDANLGAEPTLYRVRLSDRKLEAYASLKDLRRAGFFGPWLGITPDGSPLILEDKSLQDLYSISVNLP